MRLASLGSGSRGNATLLEAGDTRVLIDNGFSLRDLERRAARLQFDLQSLDAILVTHEHSDHCSGVASLSRRYELPVFMTHGTWASGRVEDCAGLHLINADASLQIGPLQVDAVAVPHDAREPVQYVFRADGDSVGVLTDLGSVTPHVQAAFRHCDLLLLEFNHDSHMLAQGPYPPALKRRVGGDWGHLSNGQAVAFLRQLDLDRLRHLVVAHTSDKNNSREQITDLIKRELPQLLRRLVWADQSTGFSWLSIARPTSEGKAARSAAPLAPQAGVGAY